MRRPSETVLSVTLCCVAWTLAAMTPSANAQRRSRDEEKRLAKVLESDPVAALRLARVDGRYALLLRQFRANEPGREPIVEKGYRNARKRWRDQRDLPAGHWVYVRPYWFIWRDRADERYAARRWGPEQVTGEPDGQRPGDQPTAWATKLASNPETEWLVTEYERPLKATAIRIHENFNPGAISRVSIFTHDGEELEVWDAKSVAPTGKPSRVLEVPVPLGFVAQRVKIYLETSKVPGWNEIDAVGVVDDHGETHWATAADASTTYAGPRQRLDAAPRPQPVPLVDGVPVLIDGIDGDGFLLTPKAQAAQQAAGRQASRGADADGKRIEALSRELARSKAERAALAERLEALTAEVERMRALVEQLQRELRKRGR